MFSLILRCAGAGIVPRRSKARLHVLLASNPFCSAAEKPAPWWTNYEGKGFDDLLSELEEHLKKDGAQKQECFQLLFKEVNSKENAQKALEALEHDIRCRRHLQQHRAYSVDLAAAIMKALVRVDATDLMMQTVARMYELGIPPHSDTFAPIMEHCLQNSEDLTQAQNLVQWLHGYDVVPCGQLLQTIEARADDLRLQDELDVWKGRQEQDNAVKASQDGDH